MQPVFQNSEFKVYKNTLIKQLNEQEVNKYLSEMKITKLADFKQTEKEFWGKQFFRWFL